MKSEPKWNEKKINIEKDEADKEVSEKSKAKHVKILDMFTE